MTARLQAGPAWAFILAAALVSAPPLAAQTERIVEWVEDAPASDADRIALGYPVPVPVDTPMPFDGFRTYAGLHARHQDLAAGSPVVHAGIVGTTRKGREIWAYRLGDADLLRPGGAPEPAMLTNGGIHAREWQSPEVVTGILELMQARHGDHWLYDYLLENANVIVIPVLNVDGFLQTQRYPSRNWLGSDINDPDSSPRDGRMRRKNLFGADEILETRDDHLEGVDLNRNSPPYWSTSPGSSSADSRSLVHHGMAAASEPETQALQAAAELGPVERLSVYTDVHSFSQVQLWVRDNNQRLAIQTEQVLRTFRDFHQAFPAGKRYVFNSANSVPRNQGIGSTDEYFMYILQVPAWTLEVEPSGGGNAHPDLPGTGADYGGLGRNGHDGFILPESQIRRVRTQLAETFAIVYYRQSGPPSVTAVRITDAATGAVVFDAAWDPEVGSDVRTAHTFMAQPLQFERDYQAWIAFDKPMRWRVDGADTALPGQPASQLEVENDLLVDGQALSRTVANQRWLDQPGGSPSGYHRYLEDALAFDIRLPADAANTAVVTPSTNAVISVSARDMTGLRTDANPATVARWQNGAWAGYEDTAGATDTDSGGSDRTLDLTVTADPVGDPFVIEPGTSAAWYDPARSGEGFMLEILADDRALMYWFTYDDEGEQDWYLAVGDRTGNRIVFAELLQVSGGIFGPDFDPGQVTETVVGSAEFIWSGCDAGVMRWQLDGPGAPRGGRMNLRRLSRVMGIDCGQPLLAPEREEARLAGSWYDPSHAGEGYTVEILADSRVLVYWFSFGPQGERRWFFGVGAIDNGRLVFPDLLTTRGGKFGDAFDPDAVEALPWGGLELELDCEGGTADFTPSETGFPAGSLQLARLTSLQGLDCEAVIP
ncbi:M14 family zinc carboxypeptidase [Elongatibacter sediminis]|uniref:M14 family zinc carboxypeptidase n=1 Tax=Elongatibacter sediminis TaxID=3119006 RepID=A0AAW9RHQ8_9GAMM